MIEYTNKRLFVLKSKGPNSNREQKMKSTSVRLYHWLSSPITTKSDQEIRYIGLEHIEEDNLCSQLVEGPNWQWRFDRSRLRNQGPTIKSATEIFTNARVPYLTGLRSLDAVLLLWLKRL